MMYGWSFAVPTTDDLCRLLRALGKHRYLAEMDHRVHFSVDIALGELDEFASEAARFEQRRLETAELELASRDPRLWRPLDIETVRDVLSVFWSDSALARRAKERLSACLRDAGIERPVHAPHQPCPDEAPHPELLTLDWQLLSVDALDTERHAGALRAMERAEESVNPSEPPLIEAMTLTEVELGAADSPRQVMLWADGPYSYCDYVFRGAAKVAKLPQPPVGYHDVDKL